MVSSFKKVHPKFKLNGMSFNYDQLKEAAYSFVKEGKSFEKSTSDFLLYWTDNTDFIKVKTSGSTGRPKTITLKKQALVNSAIATGNFFNLKPGYTTLHCLSTDFIAGKIMLVRAIVLGLEIDVIEPVSNPLEGIYKTYDFCAMVPLQLQNSLQDLNKIKTLIVGGAPVTSALQEKIKDSFTHIYATYGMTETISHIAVKQLNNFLKCHSERSDSHQDEESHFITLPNITISQDSRNCLVIDAPKLNDEIIITNDIVKLHSKTTFEILGRFDNMINSGGIKLFPEQIEAKLQSKIVQRFFIASEKDETLGDKLILIIEGTSMHLKRNIFKDLDAYQIPKQIYAIPHFKETSTGKVQRAETLKLLK